MSFSDQGWMNFSDQEWMSFSDQGWMSFRVRSRVVGGQHRSLERIPVATESWTVGGRVYIVSLAPD